MKNLVQISNNIVTTTSKQIADIFGKKHRDIIRAIHNLDIPKDFRVRNFAQSSFVAENRSNQQYKCYEITRDGFTLLAMGFTGKKAMAFKIKYIEAFNAMEKELREIAEHRKTTFAETLLSSRELKKENQLLTAQNESLAQALLKNKPIWRKVRRYRAMGLSQTEIARLISRHRRTVQRYIYDMRGLGIDVVKATPQPQQLALNFNALPSALLTAE